MKKNLGFSLPLSPSEGNLKMKYQSQWGFGKPSRSTLSQSVSSAVTSQLRMEKKDMSLTGTTDFSLSWWGGISRAA